MLDVNQDELRETLEGCRRVIAAEAAAGSPDSEAVSEAYRRRVVLLWVLGDMESCWMEYDLWTALMGRLARRSAGEPAEPRRWTGSKLRGRSLLVDLQCGGFGDLFQFSRFAAGLAWLDGPVTLYTRPELIPLFSRSLPSQLSWVDSKPAAAPDLVTGAYELPVQLRWSHAKVAASAPYLYPSTARKDRWRQRLAAYRRPWVGLCWTREEWDVRCIPLTAYAPLLRGRQATFISLQQGGREQEIVAGGCGGGTLVEFAGEIGNFDDTAALISNLDLVISIDTSIGHLAGALGRPTWLMLIHRTADTWNIGPTRDTVHWYPTMRLFRQARADRWDEALAGLEVSLSQLLASFPRDPP